MIYLRILVVSCVLCAWNLGLCQQDTNSSGKQDVAAEQKRVATLEAQLPHVTPAQQGLTVDQRALVWQASEGYNVDGALSFLIRLDKPLESGGEFREYGGHIGVDSRFRFNIETGLNSKKTYGIRSERPFIFRVVVNATPPSKAGDSYTEPANKPKIGFGGNQSEMELVGISGDKAVYQAVLSLERSEQETYTFTWAATANANDKPRSVTFQTTAPKAVDFTYEFGAYAIYKTSTERPAWGLRKGLVPLGNSKRLSLDAITMFDGNKDVSLGGALTYNILLGSGTYEDIRGIFGFPMAMYFSLGFEGFDAARPNTAGKVFFGIGISIPTSKLIGGQ